MDLYDNDSDYDWHYQQGEKEERMVQCDFCPFVVDTDDTRTLKEGKIECYWCRYYYRDKHGLYKLKTQFSQVPRLRDRFKQDQYGHWYFVGDLK